MVSIKKKKISNKIYHYLQYTYRVNGKVHYKEKYIGEKIPKDICKKLVEDRLELMNELIPVLEKNPDFFHQFNDEYMMEIVEASNWMEGI